MEAADEQLKCILSPFQLFHWFKANGGVEKATMEQPLLTEERKLHRVEWASKRLQELATDKDIPFVWLDEKWFYCRNRRKRVKMLPFSNGEAPQYITPTPLRVVSCRHAIKVMYMGVIARPNTEHNFDGKIDLLRVSEERKYK